MGNAIKVKVGFTDGGDTVENRTSLATAAVVRAAETCASRTGADWCTRISVGVSSFTGGTTYGYLLDSYGQMDERTIDYGPSFGIKLLDIIDHDTIDDMLRIAIDASIPRGSVFNLGGTTFTAGLPRSLPNLQLYEWARPTGFSWIGGQEVTVSANLAPLLTDAAVDGTSLVLSYAEDLNTGSVPAASAYTVTVAGATVMVESVAVAGRTVTLTLASATTSGQTVTVSYTVPATNPVQDTSDLDAPSLTDEDVTNNTAATNSAATGAPTISGVPQVGRTLTADTSMIMDANGLPSSFDYQWVRVDDVGTETNVGTNASTYTVATGDVGSTIRVDVSFTDNADNSEGPLASDAVPAVAAAGACSADDDWSATLTVGLHTFTTGTVHVERIGYVPFTFGELVPATIRLGSTDYTVGGLERSVTVDRSTDTVSQDILSFDLSGGELPYGTMLDFGGTELEVNADSDVINSSAKEWNFLTLGLDPTWVEGQVMAVCANLPPGLASAAVDGTSLVLTYDQDLDTGSVPATSAYAVTVDGSAATVASVAVAGRTVTLTLGSAVTSGQTVTVGYTVPATGPVQDGSGLDGLSFSGQAVTNNTGAMNVDATGEPEITGTAQVGQTLAATQGSIADTDGLPTTTFPDGYTFQWVRTSAGTDTDIAGATSSVRPTTDGGDTVENRTSAAAVVRAPETCASRTHADWCTTDDRRSGRHYWE